MTPAITDPALAALLDDLARAQARLHAYLAEVGRVPGVSTVAADWPATAAHPDLLTVAQAAARAGRSTDTIGRWCRERGIGKMYGARWRVSAARLDAELR